MEDFYIDKLGHSFDDDEEKEENGEAEETGDLSSNRKIDLFGELPDKFDFKKTKSKQKSLFSADNTYLITSYKSINNEGNVVSNVSKILQKSDIRPGLEKQYSVPCEKNKRSLKLERKSVAQKTKGKKWFDMKATELTEEIKTDFEILKMRSVLDRKHVYKKNDIINTPKYFQVGRIVESAADFYTGRIPKSQRKKTLVEELLADAEFKKYQKKKFKEIMNENRRRKHSKKHMGDGRGTKKGKSKK